MSVRMTFTEVPGTKANIARIRKTLPMFMKGLEKELNRFGNDIVRQAKVKYLTGPRPQNLGVVTGRLRSSVNFKNLPNKLSILVGTDVPYGAKHEWEGVGQAKTKRPFIFPAIVDKEKMFVNRVDKLTRSLYGK